MDNSDELARKLDEEFKLGLVTIRPYILRLTSVEDARLCRLWLDKLHDSIDERSTRNDLLCELKEHVKSGVLKHPFNTAPNGYPLSFLKYGDETLSAISRRSENSQNVVTYSIHHSSGESEYNNPRKMQPRRKSEPFTMTRWKETTEMDVEQTHNEKTLQAGEDHSQALLNTIASLHAQNEALKQEIRIYQGNSKRVQENLNISNEEVIALRARLSELQRINNNIEESHLTAVKECRKTFSESLSLVLQRLTEVKSNIGSLESRFAQGGLLYLDLEKELKKEINNLKYQLQAERKSKQLEIDRLQEIIDEKQKQLKRVDLQVKKQCSRMQEEVSHIKTEIDQVASENHLQLKAKISDLKKNVARLERTNKKLVTGYETHLQTCKHGYDQKVEGMEMIKKKGVKSLETAVIELEQRYRKIVSELEARGAAQRKKDAKRIQELEEQLARISSNDILENSIS